MDSLRSESSRELEDTRFIDGVGNWWLAEWNCSIIGTKNIGVVLQLKLVPDPDGFVKNLRLD